jgi:hypothetical protein
VDNLNELEKEKRPPDEMLWNGTSEDLNEWLETIFKQKSDDGIRLTAREIEG